MPAKRPQLSTAQAIGRDAEKIFESLLSARLWNDIKTPQERDFGLDYRVEAVDEGELNGAEFCAQVKGFSEIDSTQSVSVKVNTSTVRYWRAKILPILIVAIDCAAKKGYFCWFDRSFEPPENQKTCSFLINTEYELTDSRLRKSLEPYYRGFRTSFFETQKHAFYRRLFNDSVLMMHLLLQTHDNLLFCDATDEARHKYLAHYFNVLSVFIHDVHLYTLGIDLNANPIDRTLSATLARLKELHDAMCRCEHSLGSKTTFKVDAEAVYYSLPQVSSIFSDITLFFRKRLYWQPADA